MQTHLWNDTEALLHESAWLRRLASQLVRDPMLAEDVAQEALLAWTQRRPEGAGRSWLAQVLRNLVRQDHRAKERRRDHEARASRTEATASALEMNERLEVQRRVVEAVQALHEPYRTTLALRFLEELPPREIARRTGTPVGTVRTRLERGLAQLREALDASHGGRERWLSALVPLVPLTSHPTSVGIGVLAMGTALKLAGSVLGLAALVWFLKGRALTPAPEPEELASTSGPVSLEAPLEEAVADTVESEMERTELAAPLEEGPAPVVEAPSLPTFTGRVLDLDERPVAGARVNFVVTTHVSTEPPVSERWCTSAADGTFEMVLYEERGRLEAGGADYATVVSASLGGTLPVETPTIVVARKKRYAGRVVDPQGAPVEGAELDVRLPEDLRRRWHPGPLGGLPFVSVKTDAAGEFDFEAGQPPGAGILVRAEGFEILAEELPSDSILDWLLQLQPAVDSPDELSGMVVDAVGVPVPGSWVSVGRVAEETDEEGRFRISTEGSAPDVLRAVAVGYQPAELALAGMPRSGLLLTLGEEALTIRGRALDASGAAVEGALVWTTDGTRFGKMIETIGELRFQVDKDLEEMIVGRGPDPREAHSGADGGFELRGLVDRMYSVQALHPITFEHLVVDVRAGEAAIVLSFPGVGTLETVAGRIETYSGDPVAGVRVAVQRPIPTAWGNRLGRGFRDRYVTTDETGTFEVQAARPRELVLRLQGEVLATGQDVVLETEPDLEDVRVRVPGRAHLRVILEDDPDFEGAFSLIDAEGELLSLTTMVGSVNMGAQAIGIEAGRSGLVQANESAVTLILYEGVGEERRVPVELRAGEVTIVNP